MAEVEWVPRSQGLVIPLGLLEAWEALDREYVSPVRETWPPTDKHGLAALRAVRRYYGMLV